MEQRVPLKEEARAPPPTTTREAAAPPPPPSSVPTDGYPESVPEAPASVYSGDSHYSPVGDPHVTPIYSPPSALAHDPLYAAAAAAALSQSGTLPPHHPVVQPHLSQVYPAYYPIEYAAPTLRPEYRSYQSYGRSLPDDPRAQYPPTYPPPYHF